MEKWLECMENLWKTYPFPTFSHWDKQERTAGKSQTPREQSGRPRTEEVLAGVRPESQTAGDGRCLAGEVHPESQAWDAVGRLPPIPVINRKSSTSEASQEACTGGSK